MVNIRGLHAPGPDTSQFPGPRRAVIYLVRHGQTEFNVARRYQGQGDSPLTLLGQMQAKRMGERLAGLVGDPTGWRIVSSPLGRAVATAKIIARALGGAA